MSDVSRRRAFLAPEVIQTSAMDCGPASLASVSRGLGVPVNYANLREACQTDVDGTSIDALESLASQLGLAATQILLPPAEALLREPSLLPAIAVARRPGNIPHFVAVWRRYGPLVQVMDPSAGRRWMSVRRLLLQLYEHETLVTVHDWRQWATGSVFRSMLRSQLLSTGVSAYSLDVAIDRASEQPGWKALAAIEAATRMTVALVDSCALRRGTGAAT